MVDLNATLPFIELFASTFQGLIGVIKWFVGGIFGLYVIMLLVRIYSYFKLKNFMKYIELHLVHLSDKIYSMDKKLNAVKGKKK